MINDGKVPGAEPMRGDVPRVSTATALAETEHREAMPAARTWHLTLQTALVDLTIDGERLGRPRRELQAWTGAAPCDARLARRVRAGRGQPHSTLTLSGELSLATRTMSSFMFARRTHCWSPSWSVTQTFLRDAWRSLWNALMNGKLRSR